MEALDGGMSHIPGGTEQSGLRFHHLLTHNGTSFQTYELPISETFPCNIFEAGAGN